MYDVDISYAATKAHVYRTYLIPIDYIKREIAGAGTLEEMLGYLHMTAYGEEIAKLSDVNLPKILEVFKRVFTKRVSMFSRMLGKKERDVVDSYLLKLDIERVLEILAEKIANKKHKDRDYYELPFSKVDYAKLLSAETVDECIDILLREPLNIENLYVELWKRYRSLFIIELGLLSSNYMNLIKNIEKLSGEDKDVIFDMIGTDIDILNISIALGPILYGYSPELINKMFIPFRYRISTKALREAYKIESKTILKIVPEDYKSIVEYYLVGDDVKARVHAQRLILRKIFTVLPRAPISFAYVFGILRLFEFEYKNLGIIASGIESGLKADKIREMIVLDEL
ncbi:MAG: V-type ATPase subunit [Candidatus Njordarchaeota archaeon]